MDEIQQILDRIWTNLLDRPSGALALRFFIQPIMAAIFGVRDGLKDARTGRSPYFWTVLSDPTQRRERLREGVAATGKIMILAIVLDVVYQYLVLDAFYPLEAVIVALVLAFVPYLLIRGPVERLAVWWQRRREKLSAGG
jgi:hypothetical protein